MLSLSFDVTPVTLATLVTSSDCFPPKILSGSSRGRTSREGVGMMCLGRRGSSDRAWSLLLRLIGVQGRAVVAVGAEGIFVAEIWAAGSSGVAVDFDLTHSRNWITSSDTLTTWLRMLKWKKIRRLMVQQQISRENCKQERSEHHTRHK